MIGLGSIGQRHVRNISKIIQDVEFIAYRKRGLNITFSDDLKIREHVKLEEEYNIRSFNDLDIALEQKPAIVFVTNISSEHIACAIKAAEAGCDIFIEKPLACDLNNIERLEKIVKAKKLIAFMGFQNRYHSGISKLREILSEKEIGKVLSVEAVVGERLTTMHIYEDYRMTYMAQSKYGGGVILNQIIHELDYLRWIFGTPSSVYSVGGKLSSMEIDVEDMSESLFMLNNNGTIIPMRVHADFLQYPPSRYCRVICDNGKAHIDLINNTIEWSIGNDNYTESFNSFTRNNMFITELNNFFSAVKNRTIPDITIADGIASLKMALAIKDSMKNNIIIPL
jgi:predicted dehydrogenase